MVKDKQEGGGQMKKQTVLFVVVFLLLFFAAGCTKQEQTAVENHRVYVLTSSEEIVKQTVYLQEDGRFTFDFSAQSSYIGTGAYTEDADRLTLITDDGNYCYLFDIVEDRLVFDAAASSEMTWYANLADGAVFVA